MVSNLHHLGGPEGRSYARLWVRILPFLIAIRISRALGNAIRHMLTYLMGSVRCDTGKIGRKKRSGQAEVKT